jgi:hypothetical protein
VSWDVCGRETDDDSGVPRNIGHRNLDLGQ